MLEPVVANNFPPVRRYRNGLWCECSAELSPDRLYRYALWRRWGDSSKEEFRYVMFVGLNPSTADEVEDDPTIRRCIGFARAWGYDGLCMANLFAFRTKDTGKLLAQADPVGPGNDSALLRLSESAAIVVAAWGTLGGHLGRDKAVRKLLPSLHCLRLTKEGHPWHPLYVPKKLTPVPFA